MIDLDEAVTNLVDRAAAGEEIVIAKAGRPLCRLVSATKPTRPRPLIHDDFDTPIWASVE